MWAQWVILFVCLVAGDNFAAGAYRLGDMAQLAKDYFRSRCIRRVVAFACSETEGLHLMREMAGASDFQMCVRYNVESATSVFVGRSYVLGALLSLDCPWAARVFQQLAEEFLVFNSSVIWLLLGENDQQIDLSTARIRLDSEVALASPVEDSNKWTLHDVFRLDPLPELVHRASGAWSPLTGIQPQWENRLTTRRREIKGVNIRTALFLNHNLTAEGLEGLATLQKTGSIKHMSHMAKFNHLMHLNSVAMFNISVELVGHTDPGQLNPPATEPFFGILGMAERGEVEVLASGMILTPARWRILNYPAVIWRLRSMFVFLAPNALGSLDALSKPFTARAWEGVLLVLVAVFFAIKLVARVEGQGGQDHQEDCSWSAAFLSVVGTLTSQGFLAAGEWVSRRVFLFSFEVFCLVAYNYYSAAVVRFLLRPPQTTIRTPRDMMLADFRGALHDWLHTIRTISNSSDPLVREVYRRVLQPPHGLGVKSQWDGAKLLHQTKTALYGQDVVMTDVVRSFTAAELCRLREVDLEPDLYVSIGLGKHASIEGYFRMGLLLQLERGVANRELRIWHETRAPCEEASGDDFDGVGLEPVLPALFALSVGLLVSIGIYWAERIRAHCEERRRLSLLARMKVTQLDVSFTTEKDPITYYGVGT